MHYTDYINRGDTFVSRPDQERYYLLDPHLAVVGCSGRESRLLDCNSYGADGVCYYGEAIGVTCVPANSTLPSGKSNKRVVHQHAMVYKIL